MIVNGKAGRALIEFAEMLKAETALPVVRPGGAPWPWNPGARRGRGGLLDAGAAANAGAGLAAADDDDRPANLAESTLTTWGDHVTYINAVGDGRAFIADDRFWDVGTLKQRPKLPAWYWIRTRAYWKDLSELMLFWLTPPVSTAGLERGFSFQTLRVIDQDSDTRRRAQAAEMMRADIMMMVLLHREWLTSKADELF